MDDLLDENLGLGPAIKEEPIDDRVEEQPATSISTSQVDCEPPQLTLEPDPEPENDNEPLSSSEETSDVEMCETVIDSDDQDDGEADSPTGEADNLKRTTRNGKLIEEANSFFQIDDRNNEEIKAIEETNSSVENCDNERYKKLNSKTYWAPTVKTTKNLENILKKASTQATNCKTLRRMRKVLS